MVGSARREGFVGSGLSERREGSKEERRTALCNLKGRPEPIIKETIVVGSLLAYSFVFTHRLPSTADQFTRLLTSHQVTALHHALYKL
jgi:hypothetical protein